MSTVKPETSTAAREFLGQLIDYAGMFPPASLSLNQAIHNYAAYLKSADAWMLGRFVCFASQLAQLDGYAELFDEHAPLRISALGAKNLTYESFAREVARTREQIETFNAKWGARGRVDAAEMALPDGTLENLETRFFTENGFPSFQNVFLFVEIPFDDACGDSLPRVLDALAAQNIGFKLRTGGIAASAFPTTEQVARAICACCERGVPMKCTAGLHHPIRRYDASVRTTMHGFVNVFGAGIVAHMQAHARGLNENLVRGILGEENAKNFCFDEEGFAWREVRAANAEIARARHDAMIAFGSCSFDEPREDLRALGWL